MRQLYVVFSMDVEARGERAGSHPWHSARAPEPAADIRAATGRALWRLHPDGLSRPTDDEPAGHPDLRRTRTQRRYPAARRLLPAAADVHPLGGHRAAAGDHRTADVARRAVRGGCGYRE